MIVHVGCCGFPKSMKNYMSEYKVVELQVTFYKIVKEETVRRWRSMAPEDFVFIVKGFQGITHNSSSPTWKRSNIRPNKNHGDLKPSKEVFMSWNFTRRICEQLKAPICIIQTPSSFKDTSENVRNAENFFTNIERGNLHIGFEPRGWQRDSVVLICKRHRLIHVTDPFIQDPVTLGAHDIAYLRLHGSPPGKRMYNYSYTDEDLRSLYTKIKRYDAAIVYVMFNNVSMANDSKRFMNLLTSS